MQTDRPVLDGAQRMGWGSDVVADMLRQLGIDYVCLNPGASYRGLHDSLVNYLGNEAPAMLLVLHEESAVAMAHGYAKVTEKPMAAIVHSNVGLMHATMGIFNAWCDRVPIIVLGATGAVDAVQRRPWIEWIHTAKDQGALIRHYSKWDDQPASPRAAVESLLRAYQLACTAPKGPVYICLDTQLQECTLAEDIPLPDVSRYLPGPTPEPSEAALAAAVDCLAGAERPVILMGRVSRSQVAWDQRVALSELLGAPVITDLKLGAAFPTAHPLCAGAPGFYLSEAQRTLVQQADVILSLDWLDLQGALLQAEASPPRARIIHCSVDRYGHNGWSMDYQGLPPVDVPVLAEPDAIVGSCCRLLQQRRQPASETWRQLAQPNRRDVSTLSVTDTTAESCPIGLADLGICFNDVAANRAVCLVRLPLGWPGEACQFRGPLDYLGYDGGAGVGSGPGMTVGAALALTGTGRLPVAIIGDGEFLASANAVWTAAHHRIPMLIIVANNRSYFNDEVHQEVVAKRRDRPLENRWIGQRIDDPPPDLATVARGFGVQGFGPVADVRALSAALEEALIALEQGASCVLDVIITPGYNAMMVTDGTRGAAATTGD